MNGSQGQSDIDRVREATDLVRLVGEHVALRPRGREHVGLCPFHDDHRPSFAVVTHKGTGFYNCFACGAAGDCFRFVMNYHKMEFGEALRFLADRAGVTLRPRGTGRAAAGGPRRADLLAAMEQAADYFRRVLAHPEAGTVAREALEARSIASAAVERFDLGAAPNRPDGLATFLARAGVEARAAEAAGLVRRGQDVFRNRLIFPICDELGRPVAFGARVLDPNDRPKYLNSAESPIFEKSRTLYGMNLARRPIIEAGRAIVTEGYTDVIACHDAGFTNVVGTLGTALTTAHAALLGRLCDEVVLVFDADEAGRKAADRGVEIFFSAPVDVRICVLPDGLDPDTLLRGPDGAARFRAAVDRAEDALTYKLRRFESHLADAGGVSARQKGLEGFLRELADLGFGRIEGVRKAFVVNRLAELMRIPAAEIERALPRRAQRPAVPAPLDARVPAESLLDDDAPGPAVSRARRIAERELVGVLLFTGDASGLAGAEVAAKDFLDPEAKQIATVVLPWLSGDEGYSMPELLTRLTDDRTRSSAVRLYYEGERLAGDDEDAHRERVEAAARTLRERIESERYEESMIRSPGDAADQAELIIRQLEQRGRQGNRPAAIWQGARP